MWLTRVRQFCAFLALAVLLNGGAAQARDLTCADDLVLLRQGSGVQSFTVEIADTEETRARGLMFRRSLERGTGMLFIYPQPGTMAFWMRNTLIPLDIVFFDARGVIRHIHHNAKPLDETPLPGAVEGDPQPARLMVLEIGGGEARRLGLREGQAMAHPRLRQTTAVFPCP